MPNGGPGNCGGCLYNMRYLLTINFGETSGTNYFGGNPGYCTLRRVVIPDVGYTSCHNTQYDDFEDETHQRQLNAVLFSSERIIGNIWVFSETDEANWHGTPNDPREVWDYNEWKSWNQYVSDNYPKIISGEWIGNISPWE